MIVDYHSIETQVEMIVEIYFLEVHVEMVIELLLLRDVSIDNSRYTVVGMSS